MISRRNLIISSSTAVLASLCNTGAAQNLEYPNKHVTWVVPYPAGGFGDTVSRFLAQHMSQTLKQQVIVENKPGAGAQIAASFVKQQPADGYTVFYADIGPLALNSALYPKLNYNTLKDFAPITRLATSTYLLVVPANSNYKSVDDLVNSAKSRLGDKPINYGSFGIGSQPHIWMEMLKREVNGNFQHIAYKGAAPAIQDLMGGHIELMLDVAANSIPNVKEGKLRALAVVGPEKRLTQLPDVPTLNELGYGNLNKPGWTGLVAKAGTPPDIIDKIRDAAIKAVTSEEFKNKYINLGITPAPQKPEEFSKYIESETQRWGQVIRNAGITLE